LEVPSSIEESVLIQYPFKERKGMSLSEDVGRQMETVRVKEMMVREPITIGSESNVREAAILMDRARCGCLLVASGEKVVGIVTERDLVTRVLTRGGRISRTKIGSIMSTPVVVVKPEATVEEAARIMADNRVRRLPVVSEKGLVGLITVTDIAKALAKQAKHANAVLNAMARVPTPPNALYG